MPTIQLYKGGEKVAEHIAAEGAIDALEKVRRIYAVTGICACALHNGQRRGHTNTRPSPMFLHANGCNSYHQCNINGTSVA